MINLTYVLNIRTGLKNLYDAIAFIEYSNDMGDIYKNIEAYNPNKKRKVLIVFNDMIAGFMNLYKNCTTKPYFF